MSDTAVHIPTFAGFDFAGPEKLGAGALAVFGVPVDSSPPRRPGCAAGPLAIREASLALIQTYLLSPSHTVVDLENGKAQRLRECAKHVDLGDLECCGHITPALISSIAELTTTIVSADAYPILIGGDNRVSEGLIHGVFANGRDAGLLVFSNALALPAIQGSVALPLSALTASNRQLSSCPILCVGTQGLQSHTAWSTLQNAGGRIVTADDVYQNITAAIDTINTFLAEHDSVICCVDLEVIDSGHAAGTPGTNVGGPTPEQLIALMSEIRFAERMAGIAVTNTAPRLDTRGLSEAAAAECLLALLGAHLFEAVS